MYPKFVYKLQKNQPLILALGGWLEKKKKRKGQIK